MEACKLTLLIGFLGLFVISNISAATLTAEKVNTFGDSHIVFGGTVKQPETQFMNWNDQGPGWKQDLRKVSFKTAKLNISSLLDEYIKEGSINEGFKLQKDIVIKRKYWLFILTKSSLSIGKEFLPASILTAMALPVKDVVRLCSRGLTISTLSSYQKIVSNRLLNRHSRFLCR